MNNATHDSAMNERANLASYWQIFGREINGQTIKEIEIPIIQRDYAQGRPGESVGRIRSRFLDVLCKALQQDAPPVDLDFVYGDVTEDGKFYPLDGQQRLTSLFLLHCYVASRAGVDLGNARWTQFTYATRPGARQFCQFLVSVIPNWTACDDKDEPELALWLQDQAKYLLTWNHDPTIQSMLVILNDLHKRLKNTENFSAVWQRLANPSDPAIRFHLFPMKENGLTDSLYIKMNSRGKPLTEFENFKADFEGLLKRKHPDKADEFARKIDNAWTDIFWEYHSGDFLIDEKFMRYFRFITDICAWKNGIFASGNSIEDMAEQVYGETDSAPIEFLIRAFDVWYNPNGGQEGFVQDIFHALFTLEPMVPVSEALRLFNAPGPEKSVDLFSACCQHYGSNQWSYGNSLILYAVLLYKITIRFDDRPEDLSQLRKRLRIVRNLIEASNDELALRERDAGARIKNLLGDVREIILNGNLSDLSSHTGFNKVQITDENRKQEFLRSNPALEETLFVLEDHELLRGGLAVLTLDPASFATRADVFATLFEKEHWPDITGALLSKGQGHNGYARKRTRGLGAYLSFGSGKNVQPWQALFRGRLNENPHPANQALMELLDDFRAQQSVTTQLASMQKSYWQNSNTPKDWRYYFVKYPIMRGAPQGAYVFGRSAYRACMLKGEYVATFWDPYLLALVEKAGYSKAPEHFSPPSWPREFYGTQDEISSRPLKLAASGITIECVEVGWKLGNLPTEPPEKTVFDQICAKHHIVSNLLSTVLNNGSELDSNDRIELGADLLNDLITSFEYLEASTT